MWDKNTMVVSCNFYYKLHRAILTKISNSYNRQIIDKNFNHQLLYSKDESSLLTIFSEIQIFEFSYELQKVSYNFSLKISLHNSVNLSLNNNPKSLATDVYAPFDILTSKQHFTKWQSKPQAIWLYLNAT